MNEWQEMEKENRRATGSPSTEHQRSVTKSSITLCLSVKGDAIASRQSYGMYQLREDEQNIREKKARKE